MWFTPSRRAVPDANFYADKISAHPDNYRVIERMPLSADSIPIAFEGTGEPVRHIAILDTETTGLDPSSQVLELAIIRCGVDSLGNLCGIDEIVDEFNDPGFEIPADVGELTGITDDMVRGKHIDIGKVAHILRGNPVIIAHNAEFDRNFFGRVFTNDSYEWSCSVKCCNWSNMGFSGSNLGMLLLQEGFFFDAHRAYMDCLALAMLFCIIPASLTEILSPHVQVIAGGNSFDVKNKLKKRKYLWNPNTKKWSKIIQGSADSLDVRAELEFLKNLYRDGYLSECLTVDRRKAFKS